jgi:ATP-dependent Zn protease
MVRSLHLKLALLGQMNARRKVEFPTAYHEAGHVVAAFMQGVPVRSVTIVPDKLEAYLGLVQHGDLTRGVNLETDNSSRIRSRIEKLIVVGFAGTAAQRKYDRRSWRSFHSFGDDKSAALLADAVCSSPAASEAFLKWLAVTADDLIAAHWSDVEKIAKALVEEKTLTRARVRELLSPAASPS